MRIKMNELLTDFVFKDVTTPEYQLTTRIEFDKLLAKLPLTMTVHSKGIGISALTLRKFLGGQIVSYVIIRKIDRYIEDNK